MSTTTQVTDVASWENEGGPTPSPEQESERLDWVGFLARFYPDARRHDYESIAAYIEYKKRAEQSKAVTRSSSRP